MLKKALFIWLLACCAITGMAQELEITQPFKRLEHASVLASYRNEFGSFRKPALDIEFPYALIRLELEGDEHAVLKAKEKFSVYMGQHHSIQSKITDRDNEILFLVPSGAGHIELKCGDGCVSQLLLDLPRLQADAIYHGKVRYMPAAPVKDNTEGPESQFFKFRVTPQTSVVTLVIDGQEENIPMRGEGVASTRLKYGTYQYRITAERYHTEEGTITVSSSQTDMSVTLRPRFGWLTIKADNTSQGAFVFATNTQTNVVKQLGTLPLSSKEMDSGEYTLRIQKEKYKDYTTAVTIKDGETTTLSANLLPNFAHVTLTTNSGAEILLDGTSMGRGSWSGTIELGEHSVETRQTSHRSAYTTININAQSAGRSIALNNPVPIYGSLLVDGSPVDASVYVDGRKVGNAPTVVNKLLVGSHQVRIEKEGYAKQEKSVQITEGQEAVMDYALTKEEVKSTPASASAGEHEYVDLGLSVKWATCNVGASKPEDFGDYFAWGETVPKHTYDWSTYKWCKGSYDTQTKYCTSSSYGSVDNKKTLELSDDAARANWGGNWRMPTKDEQDELREKCTWTWTTQNGVNGYKVTSKSNGKSIFLPATGYRYDSSLNNAGSYGYYWSSSLYSDYPYRAYYLRFISSSVGSSYYIRGYGFNVRPVYGAREEDTTKETYFSVSATKKVTFSPGNLQYHPANNKWRFAENQTDYIGDANSNCSSSYNGWLDLFGWSTIANNFGVSTSTSSSDYSGSFVDWGRNKIGNDAPNTWRTLTYDEWKYLLNTRPNASSLKGVAQVNGVNGLILLPDNWTCPAGVSFKSGFHSNSGVDYYAAYQTFTDSKWSKLEAAGAVFLPAAGSRSGTNVYSVQNGGNYWSATKYDSSYAYYFDFYSGEAYMRGYFRSDGQSVRLVKDL